MMQDMFNNFLGMEPADPKMMDWVESKLRNEFAPEFIRRLAKMGETGYKATIDRENNGFHLLLMLDNGHPIEAYWIGVDSGGIEWKPLQINYRA